MNGVQLSQSYGATTKRQFTFYQSAPTSSWYSFNRPRNDEMMSLPWSHQGVLNLGPLDLEYSALTTTLIGKTYVNVNVQFFQTLNKLNIIKQQ